MGMIGHFGTGFLWACVKVDSSSVGTLTHVNSLENVCERILFVSAFLPPTVHNMQL
jgi:hypothetical protein